MIVQTLENDVETQKNQIVVHMSQIVVQFVIEIPTVENVHKMLAPELDHLSS